MAGAAILWVSREANLVVDDDVDGTADSIVNYARHLDGLVHHSLSSERSIAYRVRKNEMSTIIVNIMQGN